MRVYVVSDFHLAFAPKNPEERQRNDSVIEFLSFIEDKADILIMAGDIFDLWYDWKNTVIKGYFPVLKKLADLYESGCKLIFIAGNHDFWFGDFFTAYLDCDVYPDHFAATIDGKKLFVSHGDGYTTNDFRYLLFRYMLRHPVIRGIFSILHPEIALKLGRLISRTSRLRNPAPTKNEIRRTTGLDKFAQTQSASYDLIILGHSHVPKMTELNNAVYINAGDWVANNSYVEINNGIARLCYFESESEDRPESLSGKGKTANGT